MAVTGLFVGFSGQICTKGSDPFVQFFRRKTYKYGHNHGGYAAYSWELWGVKLSVMVRNQGGYGA